MAATHTYVAASVTTVQGITTIVGTVDTIPSTGPIPVTVQASYNEVIAVYTSSIPLIELYVAALMVQTAITAISVVPPAISPPTLPVPTPVTLSQVPTGTFSVNGNTYVISSVTYVGNTATITGTVNGTAVTTLMAVTRLLYLYTFGTIVLNGVIATQMLQTAYAAGLAPTTVTQFPGGTFTL